METDKQNKNSQLSSVETGVIHPQLLTKQKKPYTEKHNTHTNSCLLEHPSPEPWFQFPLVLLTELP